MADPPDDASDLPWSILGSLPRVAMGEAGKAAPFVLKHAGETLHRVVITREPGSGQPLWVRATHRLTEQEAAAVARACNLAEQFALCQEVLLRGDSAPEARQKALEVIERAHRALAPHTEETARWLSLAMLLSQIPETLFTGADALAPQSAWIREVLELLKIQAPASEVIELVRRWHRPTRGKDRWGTFLDFCRKHGVSTPGGAKGNRKAATGAMSKAWERHRKATT